MPQTLGQFSLAQPWLHVILFATRALAGPCPDHTHSSNKKGTVGCDSKKFDYFSSEFRLSSTRAKQCQQGLRASGPLLPDAGFSLVPLSLCLLSNVSAPTAARLQTLRRLPRLCAQDWVKLRKALASSTAQPIRVKWVFDFNQGWLTPKQKANLQNSYIPETTAIFQRFIKVRGGLGRVWGRRSCTVWTFHNLIAD